MKLPVFQVINYTLILIVLVLFIRYIWDMFFDRNYQPVQWQEAVRNGKAGKFLPKLEKNYSDKVRFFNWWFQVERLRDHRVPGAFAELGVYKGESARILHHMDPDRRFHLFDTFRGFTEKDLSSEKGEAATYTTENFADTSIAGVLRLIGGNSNLLVHPGYFPASAAGIAGEKFALVNIDADLYNPIRAGLEFFYPRLSPGGVIIVHDYNHKWPGAMEAVDEFTARIPESPVVLPDMECSVMIIRNKT